MSDLLAIFQQAYKDLDLFPLIEPSVIDSFRVDYGQDVSARLRAEVEASATDGKVVFTGHRGCGKSTLLKKFAVEMSRRKHFVVFFSIADMIEISDVNHINILYSIALMMLHKATKLKIKIPPATQQILLNWFTQTHTKIAERVKTEGLGLESKLFNILTAELKTESTFRDEIKHSYERRVSELVEKANQIAGFIKADTNKEILVIIDDLDKLDLSLAEKIYKENIKSLFSPSFRIIFTMPISASRDPVLVGILQSEGINRVQQFAVAKFFSWEDARNPNAIPNAAKVAVFLKMLEKRIPSELIEPDIAQEIVLKSGGVVRELVRIGRECCTECIVILDSEPDRSDVKINQEILNVALRNLRNDFARPLSGDHYETLKSTYEMPLKPPSAGTKDFLDLLHGLYILEYLNDDLWYDLHPIVLDLLRRKQVLYSH